MRRMECNSYRKLLLMVLVLGLLIGGSGCGNSSSVHSRTIHHSADAQDDSERETEILETDKEDVLTQDAGSDEQSAEDLWVSQKLAEMTIEEKICQMFMVTPETLTGYRVVTEAGTVTKKSLEQYPVGGMIYFASNLQNASQTCTMLQNTGEYARVNHDIPIFLAVDEEGGSVARIGRNSNFSVVEIPAMRKIGDSGDSLKAYEAGDLIGSYLADLGFNLDFAPDADVLTNPSNTVIGDRAFGTDAQRVSDMMLQLADGLLDNDVIPCVKHFPGHGCTEGDTHQGLAYTEKTLEELKSCELVPFQKAVDRKLPVIMVSHISVPSVTGDYTPASLSYYMVTELLRGEMGYNGVVITDAMGMGAITKHYECGEAAVLAIEAGCDMLLVTSGFKAAYESVLAAVEDGRIPERQIDTSVERILRIKYCLH